MDITLNSAIFKSRRIRLIGLGLVGVFSPLLGQEEPPPKPPIQIDLNIGHNKTQLLSIVTKPIDRQQKVEIFNLTFLDRHYNEEDRPFDDAVIQTYIAYNFVKGIGIGIGAMYNSIEGVSPNLVAQFVHGSPAFLAVVYGAAQLKQNADYEMFTQLQYRPRLSERVGLFTQLMALGSTEQFKLHNRSFLQTRVGVDLGTTQLGLALNVNQYGPERTLLRTIGVFGRIEIFN